MKDNADDIYSLRRMAIEREIDRQLGEQRESMKEAIMQGLEDTDSWADICAKMVINGINIAAKITAVMAAEMLLDAGMRWQKSDDELRRELFSVVSDGEDTDRPT